MKKSNSWKFKINYVLKINKRIEFLGAELVCTYTSAADLQLDL